jgi:hypothetical protein
MKTKASLLLIVLAVISCVTAQTTKTARPHKAVVAASPTPPAGSARVPGTVTSEGEGVTAPSTVKAGANFEVIVRTGGSGCTYMGDTSVVLGEDSADIFVYDFTTATRPGMMCTMIYKQFDHKATLQFAKRGPAVIRVWVRGGGEFQMGMPLVLERRVTVN